MACQLNAATDSKARWFSELGNATVNGNVVHVRMTDAAGVQQWFSQIAATSAGQRLGAVVKSARRLPLTEATAAQQNKPVIYGLDDSSK